MGSSRTCLQTVLAATGGGLSRLAGRRGRGDVGCCLGPRRPDPLPRAQATRRCAGCWRGEGTCWPPSRRAGWEVGRRPGRSMEDGGERHGQQALQQERLAHMYTKQACACSLAQARERACARLGASAATPPPADPGARETAKRVIYGIPYGITSYGLAARLQDRGVSVQVRGRRRRRSDGVCRRFGRRRRRLGRAGRAIDAAPPESPRRTRSGSYSHSWGRSPASGLTSASEGAGRFEGGFVAHRRSTALLCQFGALFPSPLNAGTARAGPGHSLPGAAPCQHPEATRQRTQPRPKPPACSAARNGRAASGRSSAAGAPSTASPRATRAHGTPRSDASSTPRFKARRLT